MAQSETDEAGVQIASLAAELLRHDDEIAAVIVERICAAVPLYGTESVVSREQLHQTSLANPAFHLRTDGPHAGDQLARVPRERPAPRKERPAPRKDAM